MHRRVFLLLSLTLLVPVSGRGELPAFGPPAAAAPFDDIDDAALQAEVTRQALAFLDTLQRHWGQGPERLKRVVAGPIRV
jgi:hypothetical protein